MVQEINQPFFPLRIKFVKTGSLQYISHLDLVRTMHKVLTRTKLPLWYSEGFNPKPKMVFSPPLSIGAESVCEFMDTRLTEKVDLDKIVALFNANVTDELRVLDAYYPETKLSDISWYSYTICVKSENVSEALSEKCNREIAKDSILIEKNTKKGPAVVDIKPMIHHFSAVFSNGLINIRTTLSADPNALLNPELLIKHLIGSCALLKGENPLSESYTILREVAYTKDMSAYR